MKFKHAIILIIAFGLWLAPAFLLAETTPTVSPDLGASTPKISNPLNNPKLSVSIPGLLKFRNAECSATECVVPWIADYIDALYKYGLSAIGILAVITFMIGGVLWLTAGGKEERITDAKRLINGSLFGVVIAVSSYMILNIINPALTELSPIRLAYVANQDIGPLGPIGSDDENEKTESTTPGSVPSVNGSCLPVAKNSFSYVSWNWGSRRSGGGRCHAGIDLYTKSPGSVVAIAPGTVVSMYSFYPCKKGWSGAGNTWAVFIDHGDYTINYGEIDQGHIAVKVGDQVQAGTILGKAGHCGMLHMELYNGKITSNQKWYPPSGKSVGAASNFCRSNFLSTKPGVLMDPTETIKSLESKICGN